MFKTTIRKEKNRKMLIRILFIYTDIFVNVHLQMHKNKIKDKGNHSPKFGLTDCLIYFINRL